MLDNAFSTAYTLMHKQTPVADIDIDNRSGQIIAINDIYNASHFPIGVITKKHKDEIVNIRALIAWWHGRSIPASRDGLEAALNCLDIYASQELLTKCFGLSLSDQYWIKPKGTDVSWDAVNFFDNPFSEDIGKLLVNGEKEGNINLMSPDNTSDGIMKKRWKIIADDRFLVKGGKKPYCQQPINEVIAAALCARLSVDFVPYYLMKDNNETFCMCPDVITPDTEYISAKYITRLRPKANHENEYLFYKNVCEEVGIKNSVPFLDKMICVDFLIANEDRHWGNFGLIRNAETLEWISPMPLFDHGSSLGYDTPTEQLSTFVPKCCPFKKTHEEQVRLVTSFDWIDFAALRKGLADELIAITVNSALLTEERANAITNLLVARIDRLEYLAITKKKGISLANSTTQVFEAKETEKETDTLLPRTDT